MRLIRAKDYADVSVKAANIIASVVTLKPDWVMGIATGSIDPKVPASILQLHPDCTIVADEEALSLLEL